MISFPSFLHDQEIVNTLEMEFIFNLEPYEED